MERLTLISSDLSTILTAFDLDSGEVRLDANNEQNATHRVIELDSLPFEVFLRPLHSWNEDDVALVLYWSVHESLWDRISDEARGILSKSVHISERALRKTWQKDTCIRRRGRLLHDVALKVTWARLWGLQLQPIFYALLMTGIKNDIDLHALSGPGSLEFGLTPFWAVVQYMMSQSACRIQERGTVALRGWIAALEANGVDLIMYGAREMELAPPCDPADSQPILYGFTYGSRAQDWKLCFEHPGDRYAGIFWDMIEHPERKLPGAWYECEDRKEHWPYKYWDDKYFDDLLWKWRWKKRNGIDPRQLTSSF